MFIAGEYKMVWIKLEDEMPPFNEKVLVTNGEKSWYAIRQIENNQESFKQIIPTCFFEKICTAAFDPELKAEYWSDHSRIPTYLLHYLNQSDTSPKLPVENG